MNFTADSQLVKDYVLLIRSEIKAINDVPDIFNLRAVVQDVLNS